MCLVGALFSSVKQSPLRVNKHERQILNVSLTKRIYDYSMQMGFEEGQTISQNVTYVSIRTDL